MAAVTVVNTRPTPWIVDDEGHIFDGNGSGPVDDSQERVQHAFELGVFVKVTDPVAQPAGAADEPKES